MVERNELFNGSLILKVDKKGLSELFDELSKAMNEEPEVLTLHGDYKKVDGKLTYIYSLSIYK